METTTRKIYSQCTPDRTFELEILRDTDSNPDDPDVPAEIEYQIVLHRVDESSLHFFDGARRDDALARLDEVLAMLTEARPLLAAEPVSPAAKEEADQEARARGIRGGPGGLFREEPSSPGPTMSKTESRDVGKAKGDKIRTAADAALRWFEASDDKQSAFATMRMLQEALGKPVTPAFDVANKRYLDTPPIASGEWTAVFHDPTGVHFYHGHGEESWHALVRIHPYPPTWNTALWSRVLRLHERIKLARHYDAARGSPHNILWAVQQASRVTRWGACT